MKLTARSKWGLAVGAVLALVLSWMLADRYPDQTQAVSAIALGVAVFWVTWRYTTHTAEMVDEMRADRCAEEEADALRRVAAIRNLDAELEQLSDYVSGELRPGVNRSGTRPPYPRLTLRALDEYVRVMAALPTECNAAVLRANYQLEAANARADEVTTEAAPGYWKRAEPLCSTFIPAALAQLRLPTTESAARRGHTGVE